jgi:hypothetical protein
MSYSGSVGKATFSAVKAVEHAYRRCKVRAQEITSEMTSTALDVLAFLLDDLSNTRTPSWCIEKVLVPMSQGTTVVDLPAGTVDVLNLNYRTMQELSGTETVTSTNYIVQFESATTVNTVGIKWAGVSVPVSFSVSSDGITWTLIGSSSATDALSWTDVNSSAAYEYFKVTAASGALSYDWIFLGNTPMEIPLGRLNLDSYSAQSNKVFQSRPNSYYFQRSVATPVLNLWPAPNEASEKDQLVLWRHRQIMDIENLQQEIEIPLRWYEAIITTLASKLALELPQIDDNRLMILNNLSSVALQKAWDGDSDGAPIFIQPAIKAYTA